MLTKLLCMIMQGGLTVGVGGVTAKMEDTCTPASDCTEPGCCTAPAGVCAFPLHPAHTHIQQLSAPDCCLESPASFHVLHVAALICMILPGTVDVSVLRQVSASSYHDLAMQLIGDNGSLRQPDYGKLDCF